MSTFRTPVGPQTSSVYWRRRLVVGLVILAVIVAIILVIVKPGSGTPGATKTPAPGSSSSAEAVDTEPDASGACAKGAVKVVAVTDKASYKAGENPMLSLTLTNTGTKECTFNAGTDVQEYRITSGKETIWDSTHCQTEPTPTLAVLEPGKDVTTTPFAWDRTRSSADTCEGDRPPVTAAGASYHLTTVVDGIESADTKQFQLY
ncbi:hypothetical protein EYE40_11345 [Glaciihabitans arcticus]|uniref:DUF4232 domain-containing protein n=1 Tax=Glaciihabitans arcticus TaxID=2668039 RepID=A0A4Q9GUQ9_9MICO|nr:hypothetical protein [Glaciihabitans arcticus]TBN57944.1 hypothetical protein EYE40_11345 [Glaciihabitans arcticus]